MTQAGSKFIPFQKKWKHVRLWSVGNPNFDLKKVHSVYLFPMGHSYLLERQEFEESTCVCVCQCGTAAPKKKGVTLCPPNFSVWYWAMSTPPMGHSVRVRLGGAAQLVISHAAPLPWAQIMPGRGGHWRCVCTCFCSCKSVISDPPFETVNPISISFHSWQSHQYHQSPSHFNQASTGTQNQNLPCHKAEFPKPKHFNSFFWAPNPQFRMNNFILYPVQSILLSFDWDLLMRLKSDEPSLL